MTNLQVPVPISGEDPEWAGGLGEAEASEGEPGADVRSAGAGVLHLGHDGLPDHPGDPGRARREGEGRDPHLQDPGGPGPDLPQDRATGDLR